MPPRAVRRSSDSEDAHVRQVAVTATPPLLAQIATYGAYFVGIGGALGLVFTALTWITGPLRPQSQVDLAELRASNASLQADIKAVIASAASDRAALVARLDADKQLVTSRLDAMWRPSDYADRDAHLGRLDTVFDALRERVTQLEYSQKDLAKSLQPPRR